MKKYSFRVPKMIVIACLIFSSGCSKDISPTLYQEAKQLKADGDTAAQNGEFQKALDKYLEAIDKSTKASQKSDWMLPKILQEDCKKSIETLKFLAEKKGLFEYNGKLLSKEEYEEALVNEGGKLIGERKEEKRLEEEKRREQEGQQEYERRKKEEMEKIKEKTKAAIYVILSILWVASIIISFISIVLFWFLSLADCLKRRDDEFPSQARHDKWIWWFMILFMTLLGAFMYRAIVQKKSVLKYALLLIYLVINVMFIKLIIFYAREILPYKI